MKICCMSFEEVEKLSLTGEWPMLVNAINNRKDKGTQHTVFEALFDDDGIICVFGWELANSIKSGDCIYVGPLVVHEKYRGMGIGTYVIGLLKMISNRFETKLLLYAHKDVIPFYEKQGFSVVYDVEEDYKAMECGPEK